MRHVSVAELKANADEILAAASAGEEIQIMREGLGVAKLVVANRPELVDIRTPEQRQQQREAVQDLVEIGRAVLARNGPTTGAEIKAWIEDERG